MAATGIKAIRNALLASAMMVLACGTGSLPSDADNGAGGASESSTTGSVGGSWTQQDECTAGTHDCDENASCSDTEAFYSCACNEGFFGDGFSCNDIDECASGIHDCDDNADCVNDSPGFSCSCKAGFEGDGQSCQARYLGVSVGTDHSCTLRTDSTAWCVGRGSSGRLGNGLTSDQSILVPVAGGDWVTIDSGSAHVCGIKNNGTLWCWGANSYGAAGLGDYTGTISTPSQELGGHSDWVAVAAGLDATCGIRQEAANERTLWCWGRNHKGQLGPSVAADKTNVPTKVSNAVDWGEVAIVGNHACSIKVGGTLWCWGNNNYGQLGVGDKTNRDIPTQVIIPPSLSNANIEWLGLALGLNHSCATRTDGSLWCWGYNFYGALGDGTTSNIADPKKIDAGPWLKVSAGRATSCGIKTDGSLYCWGDLGSGQLGATVAPNGTLSPIQLEGSAWTDISVGYYHLCGVRDERSYCWGGGMYGQLGVGVASNEAMLTPVQPEVDWSHVDTNNYSSCGVTLAGELHCWGTNKWGNLGNYTQPSAKEPLQVGTESDWSYVTAGYQHGCGLRGVSPDASAWCWGENGQGALGDGTLVDRFEPAEVVGTNDDWDILNSGYRHSCGLRKDKTLWCWGDNGRGELGIGSTTDQKTPTHVGSPHTWQSLSVGNQHTCGVTTTGTLYCWGLNLYGQIGKAGGDANNCGGNPCYRDLQQVETDADWLEVSAGFDDTCALKTSGTIWCWGRNNQGQHGDGTKIGSLARGTPFIVQAGTDSDWSRLSLGRYHVFATRSNGSLWAWGDGGLGKLGNGSETDVTSPIQITTTGNWSALSADIYHSCLINGASKLYCLGGNHYGQLGLSSGWPDSVLLMHEP